MSLEKDYSVMVATLAKPGKDIVAELTNHKAHLMHMAYCIGEEAGEVQSAIKKHLFYDKPLDVNTYNSIVKELGDLEFYLEGLRATLGITRHEVLIFNMEKLNKRYDKGSFSNQQANDRVDVTGQ